MIDRTDLSARRVALVAPYFGTWPIWFPALLRSCGANETVDWFVPTDCKLPDAPPENVHFMPTSMADFAARVEEAIGTSVNVQKPVKLCDLKPAYGHVLQDDLQEYDYIGFCDSDVIWGDIRRFIDPLMAVGYDLITSRVGEIAGHFTIMRNEPANVMAYRSGDHFREAFSQAAYQWFDEGRFADIIRERTEMGEMKTCWDRFLVNNSEGRDSHQEYLLDRWKWTGGSLVEVTPWAEVPCMYLHFINWKRTFVQCDDTAVESGEFYISYTGIHASSHTRFQHRLNRLRNLVLGYHVSEWRRLRVLRARNYVRRQRRRLMGRLHRGRA